MFEPVSSRNSALFSALQQQDQALVYAILDAIAAPVLILQLDGMLVAANDETLRLTGYSRDDLLGRWVWDALIAAEHAHDIQSFFNNEHRVLTERHMVNRWQTRNGDPRLVSWGTTIIRDEDDTPRLLMATGHDVTNLQRASDALRESEANYRRLVMNMSSGLGVQDATGILTYVNRGFADLVGFERDELVGRRLHDLLPPDSAAIHQQQLEQRQLGHPGKYEMILQHRDGDWVTVEVSAEPIVDNGGRFQGSFAVLTDITDRRQAEAERLQQIDALESFASTVAHDLKNPLNMVMNLSQVVENLYDELSDEQVRGYLTKMTRQSKKMNAVIDELMVLASVDSREIVPVPLNMVEVLNEARLRIDHYLQDYPDARLTVPQQWPAALGHAPWVEEVWTNYLTNALKYGGRPAHVRLGAEVLADGMVRFWVRDNGPGIDPADQRHLFKPWQRLDSEMRAQGHGLGLSIVRRILERLDGEVGVDSEPGLGSEFWFTLPPAAGNHDHA